MRAVPLVLILLLATAALPLSAQEPSASPTPEVPAPAGESEQLAPGEIRIRAETQGAEQGHYEFRGFVDLRSNEFRIQADRLDFFEQERPGQAPVRRIAAEGNVVFIRGDERLSGERMEMDLDTKQGFFEDALGYVTPGVFVEADRIERLDGDSYKIIGGKFTSCSQPTPRWSFSASSAKLHIDDKITAKNVVFKVKSVPAFYLPYFVYPIEEDQRSTGFLFPHFGHSDYRGFNVGTGFFWAMGRSTDQTFYLDHYSRYGLGFGHELRYLLDPPSRGTFRSYVFRPKLGGTWDYDLDWMAQQHLPGKVRATVNVRQYSNTIFQQQIQESIDQISRRSRSSSVNLQRTFGNTNVILLADSLDTFYGESHRVNRHLPTLKVLRSPKKIGRSGLVVGFEGRAENLAQGDENLVESFARYDVWPRLSRPMSASFLQFTPEVQLRHTRWGSSRDLDTHELVDTGIDRSYVETNVEMQGPNFSRVFNAEGNFYSDKYKHVIGPEAVWTYRTRVDEFDAIPKFDGNDYIVGTNELRYGLVQRFYAKRETRPGRADAYEFMTWRVFQTYYVNINEDPSVFDPNYSTSAFGPGGEPSHYSPIRSNVRFRPTRQIFTNFDLEYDVNFKQMRTLGLSTAIDRERFGLQASWSRARRLSEVPENRTPIRDTLRGSARFNLLPGRLQVQGSADYDLIDRELVQGTGRLRYDVQCCGFMVEVVQSNWNVRDETQFRFSIELANIGSIGNFMGQEATDGRRGRGGRR